VLSYDVSHRERFAAAGNTHQHLQIFARVHSFYKPFYGLWLVAGRLKRII
jgi:hypothetical protein